MARGSCQLQSTGLAMQRRHLSPRVRQFACLYDNQRTAPRDIGLASMETSRPADGGFCKDSGPVTHGRQTGLAVGARSALALGVNMEAPPRRREPRFQSIMVPWGRRPVRSRVWSWRVGASWSWNRQQLVQGVL